MAKRIRYAQCDPVTAQYNFFTCPRDTRRSTRDSDCVEGGEKGVGGSECVVNAPKFYWCFPQAYQFPHQS